jgi:oxygen-dependent protoporphyrinogen oxidase
MSDPAKLVVVGGGITGLAAAYGALLATRKAGRAASISVLEQAPRFGGKLVTERRDGFLIDGGPDSWVVSKPHASELARELGLGSRIVTTRPETRRYYVAWAKGLHAVPEGVVLGVPTRWWPLMATSLFTWRGKARMAIEPLVRARRYEGDEDESIAHFAERRLGREAADRLVAPLLGGISAGDAAELSIRATFPQLVAMERDHGSLVRGMFAARREREAARSAEGGAASTDAANKHAASPGAATRGAFESLEDGTGSLIGALVERLGREAVHLRGGIAVRGLEKAGTAWSVVLEGGERLAADAVLLAVPTYAAAGLCMALDGKLAEMLRAVRYGSTATVFLAYRRKDVAHPLDGVGFVVPRSLGRPILASTWVSSKWQGRAPEGHALVRVFVGGPAGEAMLRQSDADLCAAARGELSALMGVSAEPEWSRVFRFERGSAQMRVGHLSEVRTIRDRLTQFAPGLLVAGGGYGVVGIPDCIRDGRRAGEALVEHAAGLPGSVADSTEDRLVGQNPPGSA